MPENVAETELQQFVRDTIISCSAFGLDPFQGLLKIAEHVGITVLRDDEGKPYLTPPGIWIGDTIKLTGPHWDMFGLRGQEVVVTAIDTDGDPEFVHHGLRYVAYSQEGDVDYTATLVRKAGQPADG